MKGILGKKIGMTQVFEKNGRLIPVTVVHVEPNQVVGVKTKEKDGYDSTVIGFQNVDSKKLNSSKKGFFKKTNTEPKKTIREIRNMHGYEVGNILKVNELFVKGQCVDVQGITKGHGFTGAIKRWNFKIGPLGHGAGYPHRFQGSVQTGRGGSQAQRVFKGKKMSGHYGHDTCTVQNLSIVNFIESDNLVLIRGAIPGNNGTTILIRLSKKHPDKVFNYDLLTEAKDESVSTKPATPKVTKPVEPTKPEPKPQPAKPAEVVKPAETPKPVEQPKPEPKPEPVKEVEQPKPVEVVKPIEAPKPEPVKPVEQPKPVEPVKPEPKPEPVKQVEQPKPVEPVKPIEAPKPEPKPEPVKPVEQSKPVEPIKPEPKPEPVKQVEQPKVEQKPEIKKPEPVIVELEPVYEPEPEINLEPIVKKIELEEKPVSKKPVQVKEKISAPKKVVKTKPKTIASKKPKKKSAKTNSVSRLIFEDTSKGYKLPTNKLLQVKSNELKHIVGEKEYKEVKKAEKETRKLRNQAIIDANKKAKVLREKLNKKAKASEKPTNKKPVVKKSKAKPTTVKKPATKRK